MNTITRPEGRAAAPQPSHGDGPPAATRSRLGRLGMWIFRRRLLVLLVTLGALVLAVPCGADVEYRLSEGGITAPGSEAAQADQLLNSEFQAGSPHLVFVVEAPGPVHAADVARQGRELTQRLAAEPGVVQAASYWTWTRRRRCDPRTAAPL